MAHTNGERIEKSNNIAIYVSLVGPFEVAIVAGKYYFFTVTGAKHRIMCVSVKKKWG